MNAPTTTKKCGIAENSDSRWAVGAWFSLSPTNKAKSFGSTPHSLPPISFQGER